jgi:hypothetical protein
LPHQGPIRERTAVIRPRPTTQPCDGHLVTIEGLLVDLFIERRTLHLMDEGEYFRMFANLAATRGSRWPGYWTMPGNAARLGCTSSNISKRNF